jgi:hypothetical protein
MTGPKEPTYQDWAKRFAKACRIKPKEVPNRECLCMEKVYPTFLNPQDILDEVMKWDDADEFFASISPLGMCVKGLIKVDLITERPSTRLLKEATLFKERV